MADADLLAQDAPLTDPVERLSIFELLRRRHPSGEWAFMEEVAPRPIGGRFADAIAINLWASRGYTIHGFEVKVSRSDWLRELKQPEKAEPLFRYCNYWFLVTEKDVVKPGELPDTWGHLERRGNGLHVVKAAPKLKPQSITVEFFASLVRRAHGQVEALAEVRYRARLADAHREIGKTVDERVRRMTNDHQRLQARVDEFTKATGIELDAYSAPPLGVMKLAQQLDKLSNWQGTKALDRLAELAAGLERAATTVREAVGATGLLGADEGATN